MGTQPWHWERGGILALSCWRRGGETGSVTEAQTRAWNSSLNGKAATDRDEGSSSRWGGLGSISPSAGARAGPARGFRSRDHSTWDSRNAKLPSWGLGRLALKQASRVKAPNSEAASLKSGRPLLPQDPEAARRVRSSASSRPPPPAPMQVGCGQAEGQTAGGAQPFWRAA